MNEFYVYLYRNPMKCPEVRAKMRGVNHWAYGKTPYNKGVPMTSEQRAKLRAAFTGEKHPGYGKPCSDERRAAISKATTGIKKSTTINMRKPRRVVACPHCGKAGGANNMPRWHFDNCKEFA